MTDEPFDYGEVVVLEHQDDCGPDALTPVLDGRAGRRPWRRVRLGAGDAVPELTPAVRGVIVLGGSAGVPDDTHPDSWDDEMALIDACVERDVPLLGICLGAQMLAAARGGEVVRREVPRLDHIPLSRTAAAVEDPVFAGWPEGGVGLFIHQDGIASLPPDAVPMLDGADGGPAWRVGDGGVYGVQFHPETTADTLREWFADPEFLDIAERGGVDPEELVAEVERRQRFTLAAGVSMVGRWLDAVVGADDPGPQRRSRRATTAVG